ncbi:MAG: cyclic-di-AMP receptor [Dehalococcoidia bacterium]
MPDAQKLMVMIVSDADADGLVRALVQMGHAATKIGSTGGFLRRGNTTLLCGVPASGVEEVLTLVQRLCPARTELLTLGALPLAGEVPFMTEPVEVRVGGAVVFVVNVERFERVGQAGP